MRKNERIILLSLIILVLWACNLAPAPTAVPAVAISLTATASVPVVGLVVKVENATETFNRVDQVINYSYTVTNTGTAPLAGPVAVVDDKATVNCPGVNTVGDKNDSLDTIESLVCTSAYHITQTDLTNGSVTNAATASVGVVSSSQIRTTVTFTTPNVITLAKTANPQTFFRLGDVITYTFTIQNIGTTALGLTQFTISDDHLGAPFNCGAATTLAPTQTISCNGSYTIVQADVDAGRVVNSATASGGGTIVSAPATTTITLASPSSGLTRGSTIQHTVVIDEWLIQIGRCYGANFKAIILANPQVTDPDLILPGMILTVPNIGSNGNIYGPPCVGYHTVQSGDTWSSIAQRYNADVVVLQAANKNGMAVGSILKVPLNSAGSISVGVTPSVTATATTGPTQPTRIIFPAGTTSTTLPGNVPAQGNIRYVLSAIPGQVLNINITAPANEVALAINDSAGGTIKASDTTLIWNGPLTAGGDYLITLIGIQGTADKPYTMNISLTTPATPMP